MDGWSSIASTLRDAFFPSQCLGCGKVGVWICEKCRNLHLVRSPPECVICRRISQGFTTHEDCLELTPLSKVIVCWRYNELGKRIVKSFKVKLQYSIAETIAELTAEIIEPHINNSSIFVPIPSTKKRVSNRGFNQTEILARKIGGRLGIETVDMIRKSPKSEHQTGKNRAERTAIKADAFEIIETPGKLQRSTHLILVDDVCTTGSTLTSCARALEKAGFQNISAIALFRGKRVRRNRQTLNDQQPGHNEHAPAQEPSEQSSPAVLEQPSHENSGIS